MDKSVSKSPRGARLLATDAKDHHANAFCMIARQRHIRIGICD